MINVNEVIHYYTVVYYSMLMLFDLISVTTQSTARTMLKPKVY